MKDRMPWPKGDRGVVGISCRIAKLHVLMLLASAVTDRVGDGAKPDFLPEQKRTNYSVKWPGIGGQFKGKS